MQAWCLWTGFSQPLPPSEGTCRLLAIETHGLVKRFGHRAAVDGIDFAVPRGSVFGFLGPNGSGKTTTIRVLLGLASANSGDVRVLGKEMPQALASVLPDVGALVEGPGFYPFLSGTGNLLRLDAADRHASSATRRQRVHDALDRVGLSHAADKKVRAYSLGMKQRLGLANAMLRPRELLVLDEPTNGLDPQGTREVRNLVRSLAAGGTTVFVSSHLLGRSGTNVHPCGRDERRPAGGPGAAGGAAVFRRGARYGSNARRRPGCPVSWRAWGWSPAKVHAPVPTGSPRALKNQRHPGRHVGYRTQRTGPEAIVAALVAEGVRVRGFTVENASLEERFVSLTGEGFDVVG
jgi:ABC-2 type transport system ATP-binding protein